MSPRRLIVLALASACGPAYAPATGEASGATGAGSTDAGSADSTDSIDATSSTDAAGSTDGPPAVDPACREDGCLREVIDLGAYTRADLAPFLDPGVQIDNGYRVLAIRYATHGLEGTATVTLPADVEATPQGGWPVVANAHGTIGVEDPCELSGTISGAGLAGLFGARGAIGVAPDYPGLGTPGLHAYLSTEDEGTSVLDALRAARHLARREGVPTGPANAIVGLSQGGHAVFAAAKLHAAHAPELDIRAFGVAAPASAYAEHWRSSLMVDGDHVPLVALLVWDWTELAGAPQDMWAPALAPAIDGVMRGRCMWSPAVTPEPTIPDAVPPIAADVFTPEFIASFEAGDAGPWAHLGERFARERVVPFTQTAPIRIWQGTADVTVLPAHTQALVDDLNAGGMQVELTLVPGGDHLDTAFGFLARQQKATAESVAWILARLQ